MRALAAISQSKSHFEKAYAYRKKQSAANMNSAGILTQRPSHRRKNAYPTENFSMLPAVIFWSEPNSYPKKMDAEVIYGEMSKKIKVAVIMKFLEFSQYWPLPLCINSCRAQHNGRDFDQRLRRNFANIPDLYLWKVIKRWRKIVINMCRKELKRLAKSRSKPTRLFGSTIERLELFPHTTY